MNTVKKHSITGSPATNEPAHNNTFKKLVKVK